LFGFSGDEYLSGEIGQHFDARQMAAMTEEQVTRMGVALHS